MPKQRQRKVIFIILIIYLFFGVLLAENGHAGIAEEKIKKAYSFYKKGEFSKALSLCNDAISSDSEYPNAWLMKGMILVRSGDFHNARNVFNKSLSLLPSTEPSKTRASFFRNIAQSSLEAGRYHDAIMYSTESIIINPSEPKSYIIRGFACTQAGKVDLAIENFEKANDLDPGNKKYNKILKTALEMKELKGSPAFVKRQEANERYLEAKRDQERRVKAQQEERRRNATKREQAHYEKYKKYIDLYISTVPSDMVCSHWAEGRNNITTYTVSENVNISFGWERKGEQIYGVNLPIAVSKEILNIANQRGFKTSIRMDLPFIAWFAKTVLRNEKDPAKIVPSLCYFIHLVRTSQFKAIQTFINGYLSSIS